MQYITISSELTNLLTLTDFPSLDPHPLQCALLHHTFRVEEDEAKCVIELQVNKLGDDIPISIRSRGVSPPPLPQDPQFFHMQPPQILFLPLCISIIIMVHWPMTYQDSSSSHVYLH